MRADGRSDAREALARALTEELTRVPLSRVSVRRLSDLAGVSRQAFYYHFANVNDLTVWVFTHEIADRILAHASYDQWSDGFLSMLVWMRAHPDETYAVIESLSVQDFEIFLHRQLRAMMEVIAAEVGDGLEPADDDLSFVIDHFTLSVLGHLSHWLATRMRDDPYVLVERIERILHGQVRRSLELFAASPTSSWSRPPAPARGDSPSAAPG
ncbi:TetR/AcrR family transcriptional regulator [Actinomyces sp. B33]|uniref:TetR/AcrR family transcriptional regulator n=1 Tax=Actinomyces sp. B33 TaxID=2942131 RepID=UPI0023403F7C|nr:TetR/AcrR family transcriptional regulator [Actinomyces sp. B33]MDC4232733.1 TetR/AcrR family transcriptional regulator [Actinomyces sp. B33]